MPESEEDKVKLDSVAIAQGMVAIIAIIFLVALALIVPGLYLKLWEWVY